MFFASLVGSRGSSMTEHCALMNEAKAPPRAPAWKAEVMLLEMLFACGPDTPKSALKLARAIVVPMNAESYPKLCFAQHQ